jgi:tetratricopeptide (TPR) repeat protein
MRGTVNDPIIGRQPLNLVVGSYQKLEVDDYQRPYTWGKSELDDLFSDLEEVLETGDDHFFGTLILQHGSTPRHAKVVDGQQRLTTTFIVIATLRDELLKLSIKPEVVGEDDDEPEEYPLANARKFLSPPELKSKSIFRFSPNANLRTLMNQIVLLENIPPQEKKVPERGAEVTREFRKAVKQIRSYVESKLKDLESEEAKLLRIHHYIDALLNKFSLLTVPTKSESESLEIFLTLNNRGVPLGPSDLVRGEILKRITANTDDTKIARQQKKNLADWTDLREAVKEPETFLRHYLVATHVGKVQKKKVIDTVLERIKGIEVPFESADPKKPRAEAQAGQQKVNAKAVWDDLIEASKIYGQIIDPWTESPWLEDDLSQATKCYLHLMNGYVKTHRILLLNIFRLGLKTEDLEEVIRLLFIYVYLTNLTGVKVNAQDQENDFQNLGQAAYKSGDIEEIRAYLRKGIEENPVDPKSLFNGESDSDFVSRALLYAVNAFLSAEIIPLNKYHLEHIAPQTVTDEWEAEVSSGLDGVEFKVYEDIVGLLGNLTLLDPKINKKIKNDSFAKKTKEYKKGFTHITLDLCNLQNWTPIDISDRTNWLEDMFSIIWNPKSTPEKEIISFSDWRKTRSSED